MAESRILICALIYLFETLYHSFLFQANNDSSKKLYFKIKTFIISLLFLTVYYNNKKLN